MEFYESVPVIRFDRRILLVLAQQTQEIDRKGQILERIAFPADRAVVLVVYKRKTWLETTIRIPQAGFEMVMRGVREACGRWMLEQSQSCDFNVIVVEQLDG